LGCLEEGGRYVGTSDKLPTIQAGFKVFLRGFNGVRTKSKYLLVPKFRDYLGSH